MIAIARLQTDPDTHILWPCLVFDNMTDANKKLMELGLFTPISKFTECVRAALDLHALKFDALKQTVLYLVGDTIPPALGRLVSIKQEHVTVLSYMDEWAHAFFQENAPGVQPAMIQANDLADTLGLYQTETAADSVHHMDTTDNDTSTVLQQKEDDSLPKPSKDENVVPAPAEAPVPAPKEDDDSPMDGVDTKEAAASTQPAPSKALAKIPKKKKSPPTKKKQSPRTRQASPRKKTPKKSPRSNETSPSSTTSTRSLAIEKFPMVTALTFGDVKPSLVKAGFTFRSAGSRGTKLLFCRPHGDPKQNKQAIEGQDYFRSAQGMREYLCRNGMEDCRKWEAEERENVEYWVRYAHVSLAKHDPDKIPLGERIEPRKAIKWLKKIGMTYAHGYGDKPEEYVLGGIEFPSEQKMNEWVIRNGVPESCDVDQLSKSELHQLQVYFADVEANLFREEGTHQEDQLVRKRGSSSRTCESTPLSRRSKARRRQEDQDHSSTAPAKDDETVTSLFPSKPIPPSPNRSDTEEPQSPSSLPTFYGSDTNRLESSLKCLGLTYCTDLTEFMLRYPDSQYSKKLKEMRSFVDTVIQTKGEHGVLSQPKNLSPPGSIQDPPAASMYVCGKPGGGKTLGVKWICEQAVEKANSRTMPNERVAYKLAWLSGTYLEDGMNGYGELAKGLDMRGDTIEQIRQELTHQGRKKSQTVAIVVVDEIDFLVRPGSRLHSRAEKFLKQLLAWARDPEVRFCLIGIANSISNDRYAKLASLGEFNKEVAFRPYNRTELQGILELRIGQKIMSSDAMELIAKKMELTGDARKLLDVASAAIRLCLEKGRPGLSTHPIVTSKDVMRSISRRKDTVAARVKGTTTSGQIMLAILTIFARKKLALPKATMQRLVLQCLSRTNRMDHSGSTEEYGLILDNLVDAGLIEFEKTTKTSKAGQHSNDEETVFLSIPVEEVSDVLEAELGNKSFYDDLKNNATRIALGETIYIKA